MESIYKTIIPLLQKNPNETLTIQTTKTGVIEILEHQQDIILHILHETDCLYTITSINANTIIFKPIINLATNTKRKEKNNMVKTKRISKDEYYMNIAKAVSTRSTCLRRHYGAILVKNDEIIATGYNGSARGETNCCDVYDTCPRRNQPHNSGDYSDCPAVHAEQNALLSASRDKAYGSTLYLYGEEQNEYGEWLPLDHCEPCPICSRMIKNAGIVAIKTTHIEK